MDNIIHILSQINNLESTENDSQVDIVRDLKYITIACNAQIRIAKEKLKAEEINATLENQTFSELGIPKQDETIFRTMKLERIKFCLNEEDIDFVKLKIGFDKNTIANAIHSYFPEGIFQVIAKFACTEVQVIINDSGAHYTTITTSINQNSMTISQNDEINELKLLQFFDEFPIFKLITHFRGFLSTFGDVDSLSSDATFGIINSDWPKFSEMNAYQKIYRYNNDCLMNPKFEFHFFMDIFAEFLTHKKRMELGKISLNFTRNMQWHLDLFLKIQIQMDNAKDVKNKKRIANYWLKELKKENDLELLKQNLFLKYAIGTQSLNLRDEQGRLNRKKMKNVADEMLIEEEEKQGLKRKNVLELIAAPTKLSGGKKKKRKNGNNDSGRARKKKKNNLYDM